MYPQGKVRAMLVSMRGVLTGATRHRSSISRVKKETQVASTAKYGVEVSPGLLFLLPYDSTT